jgi:hypothetical protein
VNAVASGGSECIDEEHALARDMIDVHGKQAAVVARDNARTAALAGQRPQARGWIRVLGIIQQCRAAAETPITRSTRG